VAADKSASTQLEHWVSLIGTVAAPVTVVGAVLFYFGYVSSASEYAYFGINVDAIGFSTQSYIMRSPQTLLVPLFALTLVSAMFLMLNAAVHKQIMSAAANVTDFDSSGTGQGQHVRRINRITQRSRICGLAIFTAGVIMLFSYPYVRNWAFYGLATPLLIGIGAAIIAYTSHILSFLQRLQRNQGTSTAQEGRGVRPAHDQAGSSLHARRTAGVFIYVMITASIFWVNATLAQWSGRGLAEYAALHLDTLPSVILDTKEQLFLHDPQSIVTVTQLPPSQGQTFHYRYRGLRLLIVSQDRMFLVPAQWSPSDSTLIVPLDGSVRVQFQFENQPP
jgi:hypothetical protein